MKIKHVLKILFFGQVSKYNSITDIFQINGKFMVVKQLFSVTVANEKGEQTICVN